MRKTTKKKAIIQDCGPMKKVTILHEGGKLLAEFDTREQAMEWIGMHGFTYEITGDRISPLTKRLSIYVKNR